MEESANNNWGRWGKDDEYGSQNFIDSTTILRSVELVKQGRIISLAQPLGPKTGAPPHRNQIRRFMDRDAGDYALGARAPGGFCFAEDTIQMSTHSGTHIDALSHVWRGAELYNGHSRDLIRSTTGAQKLGADKLKPILTRGVLLNFCSDSGAPMAASAQIEADDLIAAYKKASITPLPGDAVLLRTGWWPAMGPTDEYFKYEPGLSEEGADWLVDQAVSLVGADNYAIEIQPSRSANSFPVHLRLIHEYGVPLIENLNLEEIAQSEVNTFLFILAPLALAGSTASPATPLAVL